MAKAENNLSIVYNSCPLILAEMRHISEAKGDPSCIIHVVIRK